MIAEVDTAGALDGVEFFLEHPDYPSVHARDAFGGGFDRRGAQDVARRRRTRAGQPTVTLHGRAEARRAAIGLKSPLSVSISHIRDLAVAVAVGLR